MSHVCLVFRNPISHYLFTYAKTTDFIFLKLNFMKILPKFLECRFIIDSLFLVVMKTHAVTWEFIFLAKFPY